MGQLKSYSRWAAWESEVLAKVEDAPECQRAIVERQKAVDDDAKEAEVVEAYFRWELQRRGHDPNTDCVFVPSRIVAQWLKEATRTHYPTNRASTHLKGLGLRWLEKTKKEGVPGWRWRGVGAHDRAVMCPLKRLPEDDQPETAGEAKVDGGRVDPSQRRAGPGQVQG